MGNLVACERECVRGVGLVREGGVLEFGPASSSRMCV